MRRHLLCVQPFRPLSFPEAHKDEVLADQQRALDQYAVCGEKTQHLILAHAGELFLQRQGAVEQAAGVEELLQRQSAAPLPFRQLLIRGVFLLDVPEIIGNVVFFQPFFGFLAGGTFGVSEEDHGFHSDLSSILLNTGSLPDTGHASGCVCRRLSGCPCCAGDRPA